MKNPIREQRFSSEQEVNEAYRQSLTAVTKLALHDGIFDLLSRWRKFIEHEGSYSRSDMLKKQQNYAPTLKTFLTTLKS